MRHRNDRTGHIIDQRKARIISSDANKNHQIMKKHFKAQENWVNIFVRLISSIEVLAKLVVTPCNRKVQKGTERYRKVQKVQKGTERYRKVQKGTERYRKVQKGTGRE